MHKFARLASLFSKSVSMATARHRIPSKDFLSLAGWGVDSTSSWRENLPASKVPSTLICDVCSNFLRSFLISSSQVFLHALHGLGKFSCLWLCHALCMCAFASTRARVSFLFARLSGRNLMPLCLCTALMRKVVCMVYYRSLHINNLCMLRK